MSPAKAGRVQGIGSALNDLTLRSGRKLDVEIGGGIVPTPTITRTIEGSSSLSIPIYDPDLSFLQHSLLSEKFDAEIDGLHFRYLGLSKQGKNLTLTLEDRDVAILREAKGPKRAFREPYGAGSKGTTRAEFIKMLVEEANPALDFYCPQLHVKQPIKKKSQGKKAKEEAKANRAKGLGAGSGGKVKGQKADAEQIEVVDSALRVAEHDKAPFVVQVALVAALIDESECRNLSGGDSSSVGVLQLLDIHGTKAERMEIEHCVHLFLNSGFTGEGGAIAIARRHPNYSAAEIATHVQGNAAGASVYAPYQAEARDWVQSFDGDEGGSIKVTEPYEFKVGKKETYWAAIQRLAKEVNWRAFVVAGRFYFVDEFELVQGEVRLAINPDTTGIENVDFDYNANKPVNECKVSARVKGWFVPPAAVITLQGYGPASFGSGDAPVLADAKGNRAGIAGGIPAGTHAGKGRYLVSSIEVPIEGPASSRLAAVVLKRPTKPLPEPAPQTSTVSVSGVGGVTGSAVGNKAVERMIQAAELEVSKGRPYAWGGGHNPSFTGPYDCSGFVSYLLHVGGFLDTALDTSGLAGWGEAGEGLLVTVYVKTSGGSSEEHTMIEIAGEFYMSGGGENPNANNGPCKFTPSSTYKKEFNVKRHPKGA